MPSLLGRLQTLLRMESRDLTTLLTLRLQGRNGALLTSKLRYTSTGDFEFHVPYVVTTYALPCDVRSCVIRLCLILGSAPEATEPGSPGHAALSTGGAGQPGSINATGSESPSAGSDSASDLHPSAGEDARNPGAGQSGLGLGDAQSTPATPVCFSLLEMRSFMPLEFEGLGFGTGM